MTTNVDLEKLQKDAVDIFNQGFACSESVILFVILIIQTALQFRLEKKVTY